MIKIIKDLIIFMIDIKNCIEIISKFNTIFLPIILQLDYKIAMHID